MLFVLVLFNWVECGCLFEVEFYALAQVISVPSGLVTPHSVLLVLLSASGQVEVWSFGVRLWVQGWESEDFLAGRPVWSFGHECLLVLANHFGFAETFVGKVDREGLILHDSNVIHIIVVIKELKIA